MKNLRITLANIASSKDASSLVVNEVGEIKERGADGKIIPDQISGYSVTCCCRRDSIVIKFPLEVKEEWEELKKLIENDVLVEISFEGLVLTPYALLTKEGQLLSGVSAKAKSFRIVRKEEDNFLETEIVLD